MNFTRNSMNKFIILVLMLFFLGSFAYAKTFEVDEKVINDHVISSDDYAEFEVTISNKIQYDDRFRFNYNQLQWVVNTDPVRLTGVPVEPYDSEKTTFKIRPKDVTNVGLYHIPLTIYSEATSEQETVYLSVYVGEKFVPNYVPFITADVTFDDYSIDPRKEFNVNFVITNNNLRDYDNVNLFFESQLFSKNDSFALGPKESKTIAYSFKIDEKQTPMEDFVTGTIIAANTTFRLPKITYSIYDYTQEFQVEQSVNDKVYKRYETFTITNSGNANSTQNVLIEQNRLRNIFMSYDLEPVSYSVIEGKQYAVFNIYLDKNGSTQILRTYNFSLIFVLFIILAIYVAYKIYTISEITMDKFARISKTKEGGIGKVKIIVHIKNRTGRVFHDLEVSDKVPGMFDIEKEYPIGTLKPYSIAKTKTGASLLKWHINELEPREERLISYEIKANLSVMGGASFPYAILRYKSAKLSQVIISNEVNL